MSSIVKNLSRGHLFDSIIILVIGAVSFVTALAVRDLAGEIFDEYFGERSTVKAQLIYTIVVFTIAVIVLWLLFRYYGSRQNGKKK